MDNYQIVRRIGTGFNAWVELAIDRRTGERVALKIFHNINTSPITTSNIFTNERLMLQKLERTHGVIRLLGWSSQNSGVLFPATSNSKFFVLKYYKNGDLLQYIQGLGSFKEDICKHLFMQIIQIISDTHDIGIVHRDIKLENILVDDDFKLNLTDFGFATLALDEKGRQKKLSDFLGSVAYAAPEMLMGDPYSGAQTDVFQLGVCLFKLAYGTRPFQRAHPKEDKHYRLIARNQWNKFWDIHDDNHISPQLKDLISRMITLVPSQRIELSQIRIHPWFQEDWASEETIFDEMIQRTNIIQSKQQLDKQEEQKI